MIFLLLISAILISGCLNQIDNREIKLPKNCQLVNYEVTCNQENLVIPDYCKIIDNEVKCAIENIVPQDITPQNGVIYGKVTITDCDPRSMKAFCQNFDKPEDYSLRKILISRADLPSTQIAIPIQVNLDENGYYITNLQPGKYLIDINYYTYKDKEDKSLDIPKTITIEKEKITKLNINIYHD